MSVQAGYLVPHPPLIVPEVGRGQEKAIQKTIDSYHEAARQIARIRPQTVIVISPHSVMYSDYIHISPGRGASGSLRRFGAAETVSVEYDKPLADRLCALCEEVGFPAGTSGEKDAGLDHGTLVPLYFLRQYSTEYRLIRCSLSGLSRLEHYRFGMLLREASETFDRKTVIVASGDLSHKLSTDGPYGFAPEGPVLDQKLVQIMQTAQFDKLLSQEVLDGDLCEKAAECGLRSLIIMAGTFDGKAVRPQFLSYEGPFGVGYAVCAFQPDGDDPSRSFWSQENERKKKRLQETRVGEDTYVRLARETLEGYILTGKIPPIAENIPDDMQNNRAGVFVSLKKNGQLRGCIGTTEPTQPGIAQEIRQNAVSSGTRDPRFPPVTREELDTLVYSVDVLSPSKPCEKGDLDVMRYGVIVTSGWKRGLLLPNLEGVDTVDEQISIACRKAGIGAHEAYTLERFEVVRHT